LETALENLVGHKIRIDFVVSDDQTSSRLDAQPAKTRRQMILELQQHPLVQTAIEVFDAEVTDFQRAAEKPR
jgi:hypothetical protein